MTKALDTATSIEITRAVRNVELNGVDITAGQVIGLFDSELVAASDNLAETAAALFARARDDAELVTVFSGIEANDDDIAAMEAAVADAFPDADHEFQAGGQPHYLFVISIE